MAAEVQLSKNLKDPAKWGRNEEHHAVKRDRR